MTEDETVERVIEDVGGVAGDDTDGDASGNRNAGGPVDVVLSDMAPNMTGQYELDHARSVHLARQAAAVAREVLASGGDLAVKVFDGQDLTDLEADLESDFEYVRQVRPDASRDSSSELYLVAKGFLTAPVREGDRLTVEIVDVGSEGDGVAKVEDYTLFVSGASEGETVDVRVDEVKPNFGFAQPVE
jgi:23S rRNA (uridine2552-2'-O)-methyltransferase